MAPKKRMPDRTFENMQIIWTNFAGNETQFNAKGKRNFNLILPDDLADELEADGYNVKTAKQRDDQEEPMRFLQIAVNYGNYPPRIHIVTKKHKATLTEDMVQMLDFADIDNVDLVINPSAWEVNGKSGIKAYLKSMYVNIKESVLDEKYEDYVELTPTGAVKEIDGARPLEIEAGADGEDFAEGHDVYKIEPRY